VRAIPPIPQATRQRVTEILRIPHDQKDDNT
jgi:hypothetical protein